MRKLQSWRARSRRSIKRVEYASSDAVPQSQLEFKQSNSQTVLCTNSSSCASRSPPSLFWPPPSPPSTSRVHLLVLSVNSDSSMSFTYLAMTSSPLVHLANFRWYSKNASRTTKAHRLATPTLRRTLASAPIRPSSVLFRPVSWPAAA